eukprot:TRINITY_DN27482_c0_g1_i1.p1 TRINITY_DN27482_c0_g1~~TRINITY_DN27482_c0_g1_i1.p1  ORF type:complete len:232 (+),score=35.56 TRINITY_DN27482_c0_g1_i1:99-698(+)
MSSRASELSGSASGGQLSRTPSDLRSTCSETRGSTTSSKRHRKKRSKDTESEEQKQGQSFMIWSPNSSRHEIVTPSSSGGRKHAAGVINQSASLPALPTVPEMPQRQSALEAFMASRNRKTRTDHAAHLRQHPVQMGAPFDKLTNYMRACVQTSEKAMDPTWSTDLKRIDHQMSQGFKRAGKLSGSTGGLCPEMYHFNQ